MDYETEIKKLAIEDGDIIVIRSQKRISTEQARHLHNGISGILRDIGKEVKAIVLDDGLTLEVLKTSNLKDVAA